MHRYNGPMDPWRGSWVRPLLKGSNVLHEELAGTQDLVLAESADVQEDATPLDSGHFAVWQLEITAE